MKLGSTIWLEAGAVLAQRRLALHNGYASTQIIMCQHCGAWKDSAVLKTHACRCTGGRWRTYSSDPPQRRHAGSQKRHLPSWTSGGTRSVWTLYGSQLLLPPLRRHLASTQL